MTIINFDTCDCIIEFSDRNSSQWVSTIKKCKLHNKKDNQLLYDTVLAQNRRFNSVFGRKPTSAELDLIIESKTVNRLRIRKESLVNYHEHLADHHDLSFLQNLKRILRRLIP